MQESFTFEWEPIGKVERWLPVVGFEGRYEISSLGRVWSAPRTTTRGGILKQSLRSGYPSVTLYGDGRGVSHLVHHLVAEAFIGPRPLGQVSRHGPNGKLDNRASELLYGTYAENEADKVRDGTRAVRRGEAAGGSKLTAAIVTECRRRYAEGATQKALAGEYGVGAIAMHDAITGRTWAWLAGALPATPGRCRQRPRPGVNCPEGCTCGRHRKGGPGSAPCKPGCTCGRHRKRAA